MATCHKCKVRIGAYSSTITALCERCLQIEEATEKYSRWLKSAGATDALIERLLVVWGRLGPFEKNQIVRAMYTTGWQSQNIDTSHPPC